MNNLHTCNIHNREWYYDCLVCEFIQIAEKLAEAEFLRQLARLNKTQSKVSPEKNGQV